MNATTTTTADKPKPTKIQEKRAMLIELSQEAKAMRQADPNRSRILGEPNNKLYVT